MENRPPRKILKSPVAKRRSRIVPKDQKVVLERVLGLTATTNASLACDPNTGTLAYPAGCVVVLYNPKKNKQAHIFNISKKTLTSVAFSGDGRCLITGESGHQPAVRVWDVAERVQVAEFHGHKFGISCVAFSPNMKYIVSIGTQHDMQVIVWNWRTGSKVASNKVSSKVSALAFSRDGSYFVTSGMRHVKFWYLDSSKSKINTTVPLNGRNGILGDHRNNFFCDVAVSDGRTFCVTQSGYLCQFNEKRQMDKWVELRTSCANCISVISDYIFVGCADGIVRVFDAVTLNYKVTLPRPHNLGVDIAAAVNPSQIAANKGNDIKYPDAMAIKVDEEHRKVTCIYNDHSLYVWDVHDLKKIGKAWSHLYHSSCVYGVETYPALDPGQSPVLPPHSFFTCSSDDTIRIWNLDPHMAETPTYKSNIYSHELLKVMYMDPSLASLCDIDYNPSGAADKTDTNYDDKNGIRSIRVSPDGQHLASGDRQGNVRIHHLQHLDEVKQIEAHESEVLCLEYSNWSTGPKVLASSSRDRLVHVYDTEQQYGLLQTLSDHSSSISAVKFTETDGELKMVTCGADKSILFRNLQQEPDFQFTLAHHLVEKMTLYDMDVEPSQKFAAIACQDRNVRIYNVKTGKKKKEYKGSATDDGILLRMKLDPSGSYAVTSCSDKQLCILDFYTGELLATMHGHSEIATDARFMNDLKHVISVSGDGCIFVWRLPTEMTTQMQSRLQETGKLSAPLTNGNSKLALARHLRDEMDAAMRGNGSPGTTYISPQKVLQEINPGSMDNPDGFESPQDTSPSLRESSLSPDGQADKQSPYYKFSVSQLPSWAKKQVEDGPSNKPPIEESKSAYAPRGRWAQRVEGQGMAMKQQDGKSVEVDFATDRRRFTYDGDTRIGESPEIRRETMVLNRPSTTPRNMPVIHDDTPNDDDDDDDAFRPLTSTTFVKPKTYDKPSENWEDLFNFDNDDGDQPDQAEIIYYPPSECDSNDTLPSSFQVFDTGVDRPARSRKSVSCSSNADGDSETTDPVSLEDMEEDEDSSHSTPSTPMEDVVPKTHNREKFLKDTFENLSFTPELSADKFAKGLDTLEEEMTSGTAPAFINARQSLSARFLSKSQAANIRNMGVYGSIQRQDNWFDSVQRRKDDMARNLDESRKMLMAMGWKQDSPETDGEDPFPNPGSACDPGPGTKSGHSSATPLKAGRSLSDVTDDEKTPTNRSFQQSPLKKEQSGPPASPRTPKTLRRCWSTLDLPKKQAPVEKGSKSAGPKPLGRRSGKDSLVQPSRRVANSNHNSIARSKIPTAYSPILVRRKVVTWVSTSNFAQNDTSHPSTPYNTNKSSTSRPRTLQLDKTEDKTRPKDRSTNRAQGRTSLANKKATPTGPAPNQVAESKARTSRMSLPYVSKPAVAEEPRRRSGGSNLNKSKSNSMHSLELAKEDTNMTSAVSSKPRSKWSTTKMASFASVPNLLFSDDEDDSSKKLSIYSSDRTSSNPDLSEDSSSTGNNTSGSRYSSNSKKSVRSEGGFSGSARALASRRSSAGVSENARRSSSTSRLSSGGGSRSRDESLEERRGFVKKVGISVSSVRKNERLGGDRDLMPPPAGAKVSKTKPETKFMKRAQQHGQPRRKTTSDLTLEQAKDILKGNSGILRTTSSGSRSSSSSPPNEREKVDSSIVPKSADEDIGPITDPKLLTVASEIEMTAAELRRKSVSNSRNGPLEASPNDLPVRDTPPERDLRRSRSSRRSGDKPCDKSQTAMNVYPPGDSSIHRHSSASDTDSVKHNSSCEDITRDSGLSTQEDDECPSPSVKDRIASLNKRVTDLKRNDDGGSSRQRLRSQSPDSHRSTAQVNFSNVSPRSGSGVMSASLSSVNSSTNSSSSNTTCVNSQVEITSSQSLSSSSVSLEHSSSVHNIPADSYSIAMSRSGDDLSRSGDDLSRSQDDLLSSSVSGSESQGMSSSTQSLSPPSRLTTSLTSEKLSHVTSPWTCHSNTSPPSGDTGVGSDTDTDLNGSLASTASVFRKDDRDGGGDPVACLQETISQMELLSRRAIHLYSQTSNDPRARASCQDRLSSIVTSWHDNMGVAGVHGNSHVGNNVGMTTIPSDKLTQLFQKVNDLQTDMATLMEQNHGDR